MNPSKFRNICKKSDHLNSLTLMPDIIDGKLMFILMDTENMTVKSELRLDFAAPIQTVRGYLADKNALNILADELLIQATAPVENDRGLKSGEAVQRELQGKSFAVEKLMRKYCSGSD